MPFEPFVVVLVLVFGCAAFLLWILYCLGWIAGKAGGGFLRLFGGGRRFKTMQREARALICTNERCRKVEYREGRYCSQCGSPLEPQRNSVDVRT